ncbi:GTPase-activating protein, partial [Marasmius crinis-equi]
PKVMLLDEAPGALDTQSEGIVQDALDKAAAGRTMITIAHRLSTIKDADVVYVMDNGTVLEHDSHNNNLANENRPYTKLRASSYRLLWPGAWPPPNYTIAESFRQ